MVIKSIIFALFIIPLNVQAEYDFKDFMLGAGIIDEFPGEVQTSKDGKKSKNNLKSYLAVETEFSIPGPINLYPEFGLVIPGGERDPFISKLTYWTNFLAGYKWKTLLFNFGFGWAFTTISSDGGTQTLRNGETTSEFFMPETKSTSRNFITSLALRFQPFESLSAKIQGQIFNIEDKVDRAYKYGFSLHYHFQDKIWN